jgi:hypothetical protein
MWNHLIYIDFTLNVSVKKGVYKLQITHPFILVSQNLNKIWMDSYPSCISDTVLAERLLSLS